MAITTIKIQKETKQRLEKLRENRRETYDEIIRKILYVLNLTRIEPQKAEDFLNKIDEIRKRMMQQQKEDKG